MHGTPLLDPFLMYRDSRGVPCDSFAHAATISVSQSPSRFVWVILSEAKIQRHARSFALLGMTG
jgi:hypothetical protein